MAHSFQERFREAWFDPGFWGRLAIPVDKGGRGSTWFVRSGPDDHLVLRHFCRGGLPGRLVRRRYVFAGTDSVRSFAEFHLLDALGRMGLPVPEPVAAGFWRYTPLFYQASIIIRRIPGAKPLAEFASEASLDAWRAAGACVCRFHKAGVYHADLNLMNILVSDQVYLIDFDRGKIMPAGNSGDWQAANIRRLERSLNKCLANLDAGLRARLWGAFLEGYRAP
ncbi:3-deoxy-D-manno-octulosonic acid kinase [Marinobacter subterrani]|nr:3-deoxy-D-manno-octulosonic acid kinase [Marinobacter subterrani]